MPHPVILIPARLRSSRLPAKPLADIAGVPMIVHVIARARAAALGPVVVATEDEAIAQVAREAGAMALMTGDHRSGTDRVAAALAMFDPAEAHDIAVNLQGDEPEISPEALRAVVTPFADPDVDIATLAAPLADSEQADRNAVKVWGALDQRGRIRVAGFSRQMPATAGRVWRHVGLYAYRRAALARFVALPPSPGEERERLEQLRAFEAGLRIDAMLVDACPRGVDTPADLAAVRARFAKGLLP